MADVGSVLPLQQSNPLDLLTGMMQMQGAQELMRERMLNNQLLQQKMIAQQAMGQIVQRNTNQETGEIDWDQATIDMASTPETSMFASTFAKELVDRRKIEADMFKVKLENERTSRDLGIEALAPLAAMDEVGDDDVKTALKNYVDSMNAAGTMTQGRWDNTIRLGAQLLDMEPKDRAVAARRLGAATMSTKELLDSFAQETVGLGGMTAVMERNPFTRESNVISAMPQSLTPEQATTMVQTGTDAQGNAIMQPRAAIAQQMGVPTPGAGAQATTPGQAPAGAAQEPGAAPTAAPGAMPSFTVGGDYRRKDLENAATYRQILNQAASDSQSTMLMIDEAKDLLTNFTPTAGREFMTRAGALAKTMGMEELANSLAGGDLSSAQAFRALSTQFAFGMQRQFLRNTGAWSDREMEAFQKANPNLDTDPQAIEKLMDFMQHQARLVFMQQQAYEEYVSDTSNDPTEWNAKWTKFLEEEGLVRYGERR